MAQQRKRSTLRKWIYRLILLVVVFVLCIVLLEVALRTTGMFGVNNPGETLRYRTEQLLPTWGAPEARDLDGTLYRHRPNTRVDYGGFAIATNELGLRGPAFQVEKPANTTRVLVLGDSVVLGWGVDEEHTFTRLLEQELNARPGDMRYEIINTGHNGWDTVQEAAFFEREGMHVQADLVLLVYVINDIEPTRNMVEMHLALETGTPTDTPVTTPDPTWSDWFIHQGQRVVPSTTTLLTTLSGVLQPGAPQQGAEEGSNAIEPSAVSDGDRGWERSQEALLRIQSLCSERDVPFLLLDHSLPRLPVLTAFCAQQEIPVEDFWFTPEDFAQGITNSLVDSHANPKGNILLLEKLKAAMQKHGLLGF